MAHFLCHWGCSHFGALLLDFYFTENIAKSLKRAIYAILYDSKVVVDILSTTTQVCPSCHGDNSVLMALDKMELLTKYTKAISYGIIEKSTKGWPECNSKSTW